MDPATGTTATPTRKRKVTIEEEESAIMKLPMGSASLQVESVGYIDKQTPLWWEDTLYRSDAYEFRNNLGGVHSTRPAVGRLSGALKKQAGERTT